MPEKFRNQVRFQNDQLIDLAILKPGFELERPFQNQGRFQNGQVNDLAVSKRKWKLNDIEFCYRKLKDIDLSSFKIDIIESDIMENPAEDLEA